MQRLETLQKSFKWRLKRKLRHFRKTQPFRCRMKEPETPPLEAGRFLLHNTRGLPHRPALETLGDTLLHPLGMCTPRERSHPVPCHLQPRQAQDAGRMGTGPHFSSLSSQIKTHRKHHEEPGNLTTLIISFPRAPCGSQDTPLSFGLVGILRGVWEKKKEKSKPVSEEAERKQKAPAPDVRVHPPPRSPSASPGTLRSRTSCELAPSGFLKKNTRREVEEVQEGWHPPSCTITAVREGVSRAPLQTPATPQRHRAAGSTSQEAVTLLENLHHHHYHPHHRPPHTYHWWLNGESRFPGKSKM